MKREVKQNDYKSILVEILLEIDAFCKKRGIKYYLTGGTLLGAVRHKGFIPWDDDIDIALLREDYERFVAEYRPSKEYYCLLSLETSKKYNYPFAKMVDTRVVLKEDVPQSIEMGAYVDVFPIDNCQGKSFDEACKTIDKMRFLKWLFNFKAIRLSKTRSLFKNMILIFGKICSFPFSRRVISRMISSKAKRNSKKPSKYVSGLVNITYGYGEVLEKSFFDETINVEFEGHFFPSSKLYDKILRSYYGDYLKLPPVEKRVSHHSFKCWYKE